jgi:RNA-directed DNA polymerase
MRTERRDQQKLNREHLSQASHRTRMAEKKGYALNSWARISLLSKDPEIVFNNLFSHINDENLRQAFQAIDGSKATGIDNINKKQYAQSLDENLKDLLTRLHTGTYRPQAKREVLIPKLNGSTRPIAIGCFEDKLVEWVVGKILESVYDNVFIRNSFGFRPRKGADDAIKANYNILKDDKRPFVVEIDLKNFFNTVAHDKLQEILSYRINDRKLAGLIRRFLKAEILKQDGSQSESTVGTPQGSIMSPILANIYLHHVMDKWFAKEYASKDAVQVRYADDAVFMFSQEDKAKAFLKELENRLTKFGLSLNKDKTGIINFKKGKEQVFNFLGFTFYWNHKKGWNKINLVIKTQKDKLFKKVSEYTDWLRTNRARYTTKEIWKITASKLRGHYNYFGYYCNRNQLLNFYYEVTRSMFKWLNRRSQRKSFSWKQFKLKLHFNPLPVPPETTQLKQLGWSPYVK